MRLFWYGGKSGIPCSTRDCGYKIYGFDLLDVHVQLYTNILSMFWFLRWLKSLKCICSVIVFKLDSEIWRLKSFSKEFLEFQLIP
jgi:hypothetical protein